LLQLLANETEGIHIHLDVQDLRGGDPLAIVEAAVDRLTRQIRNHGAFVASALLLDADRIGQDPSRDIQILPLAQQNRLLLVWQRPCHEAHPIAKVCSHNIPLPPIFICAGRGPFTKNPCRPTAFEPVSD
jgi:hypothetical protein